MNKKILPPRIYTGNNSLSARWFVSYVDKKGKKRKKYGNINQFTSIHERQKAAQRIVKILQLDHLKQSHNELAAKIYKNLDDLKSTWRKKTYQCKRSQIGIFLKFMEQREWNAENVSCFFLEFLTKEKRLTPSTYNGYIMCLNQALKCCDMQHLISPFQPRKKSPTPASYFTMSQRSFLINILQKENTDLWFFVQFIYYCFLRPRSELRLLKVGDIILEDKKILVPATIAKNKKQQYIAIPDAFFPIVERKVRGRNPNHYLFPGNSPESPTGTNRYGEQHRLILKRLGFDTKRYKMYSWKHTGAVAAVKAGIHIKQLQIQLRHHSLDQVDAYLRQLGVSDLGDLQKGFPKL
ncbi:tyrosine-type recombinase/integrase [Aureispira anguillae]|uniref:Site-specific integrase n=1 Tax=Aureispira anguillae TaxID=2864201 RepID=A0A915YGQ2_9BACT|nr:site-specific integrase [Aureispira anguillae]BDS12720.1 site-specific integrase [Aureispira anguillae]